MDGPTVVQTINTGGATVAVGGLVMGITQVTKRWAPEGWGPLIALIWTVIAMFVWLFSQPDWPPNRLQSFDVLTVGVTVWLNALGLYGAAALLGKGEPTRTGDGGIVPVSVAPTEPPAPEVKPVVPAPPARIGATAPAWPRAGQVPGEEQGRG